MYCHRSQHNCIHNPQDTGGCVIQQPAFEDPLDIEERNSHILKTQQEAKESFRIGLVHFIGQLSSFLNRDLVVFHHPVHC